MKQNNSVKLGEYPKWIAKCIKWALDTRKPKGVRVKLYGRGKGSAQKNNYGSLPLKFCSRAVIYIYFCDRQEEYRQELRDINSRQGMRISELERKIADLQVRLADYELLDTQGASAIEQAKNSDRAS